MTDKDTDAFLRKAIPPQKDGSVDEKEVQKILGRMEKKALLEDLILTGFLHPLRMLLERMGAFLYFIQKITKKHSDTTHSPDDSKN